MSNLANRDYTLLRPPPNKSIVLSPRYDGVEIHQGQYLATIPWDFFVPPKTKAELADEVCQMAQPQNREIRKSIEKRGQKVVPSTPPPVQNREPTPPPPPPKSDS